ncbi:MAG: hypothetical protein A2054_01430 [Deltaproteobacteria bacterium GWA2_55_10]|nr:MAG: hypothetical protein A2054_01430 [Deltaproteobacteria bacterium GWA2_55_10]
MKKSFFNTPVKFLLIFAALFSLVLFGKAIASSVMSVPIGKSSQGPPEGWKVKEWNGKAAFSVMEADFGSAINLKSSSTSSALYREMQFDIRDYPYLSWHWKVTALPTGGDVRRKNRDDQAAQVYVVFPRWPAAVNSRLVGYIWDSTAPAGSIVQSTKTVNTRYIVLRSGPGELGKWLKEERNVYEDYRTLFKEEPPQAGRLSVMIDSDDTKSAAESFIGNFIFSKEPSAK